MKIEQPNVERVFFQPDVLSAGDEKELLAFFSTMAFRTIAMRGMIAKRTVACLGYDYQYKSRSVIEVEPIPAFLADVKRRCAEIAMTPDTFDQVIVSRYPAGAGIGWHTDSPVFGDVIMGLSLGSSARLQLRPRGTTTATSSIDLPPRSVYTLGGAARWEWQHRVPSVCAERFSLTFRTVVGVK